MVYAFVFAAAGSSSETSTLNSPMSQLHVFAAKHIVLRADDHGRRRNANRFAGELGLRATRDHVDQLADRVGEVFVRGLELHARKQGDGTLGGRRREAEHDGAFDVTGHPDDARHVVAGVAVLLDVGLADRDRQLQHRLEDVRDRANKGGDVCGVQSHASV